ncbi:cytochrome P450 [Lentinus tigrinus ALCF2SS1-7]|uniref:Cytochrome P450 n=1 Tax=Lentinus tigrinus ALCF2SS1-6 TaxID=1328759 RepID=A0A5C2SSZ2_9APHY|nr:cytochrome P450 [Lentinus tigrinus ALCF2SS1-6]RPD80179.1 cytochrome P450 [Lentinus tigrinus ALCF2SS1-7]
MSFLAVVVLGVIFCAYVSRKLRVFARSPLDNIRGPPAVSWFKGHMIQLFNLNAHQFRKGLEVEYPGVVRLSGMFGKPNLLISDPLALHTVLIKEFHIFEEPPTHLAPNRLMFGPGLISIDGEWHKKQRKILNPAFSLAALRQTVPIMYGVSYKLRDALSSRATYDAWSEIDMLNWISRGTLELVAQAALGGTLDPLEDDYPGEYGRAMKLLFPSLAALALPRRIVSTLVKIGSPEFRRRIVDMIPYAPLQQIKHVVDVMDANAQKIVDEKLDAIKCKDDVVLAQIGGGKDILSTFLRGNMDASGNVTLSKEELVAQVSTLIFAGTDTTTAATTRTIHLLAQYPDVQDKLREEIVAAHREKGTNELLYDDLFDLPYLEAVCRESLRLYPPASIIAKSCRQDTILPLRNPIAGVDGQEIQQISVPKGTYIMVGVQAMNRSKELWGEDADQFKPERWLSDLPDSVIQARIPGVYSNMMTFLGGGRACIGFKFAQLDMKVFLSILLENFVFEPSDTPIRWNYASVRYPTAGSSDKPQLPVKVKRINTEID